MRIMSLRSFSREAPGLEEPVLVSHEQQIIGTWYPLGKEPARPSTDVPTGREFNSRPFTPVPKKK